MKISPALLGSILLCSDEPKRSDAIVYLEGDGWSRIKKTAQLYKAGLARHVVVSGGFNHPEVGCYPAERAARKLRAAGVPARALILEARSQHTRGQAEEVLKLAKQRGWSSLILVASHFHQIRAFLTFLKCMRERKQRLVLFNAPARDLTWFDKTAWGSSRAQLLELELKKLTLYKRHVASFPTLLQYLKQREGMVRR